MPRSSGVSTTNSTIEPVVVHAVGREAHKRILKSQKPTVIAVPEMFPEEINLSPFIFSKRFLKCAGLERLTIPKKPAEWQNLLQYAILARQIEGDSDGGLTVNDNWIKIVIDDEHRNAGSETDYILMRFGQNHVIRLLGVDSIYFPKGWWLQWDLNPVRDSLETIPTGAWDEIFLENPSGDGILIRHITIVHSGVRIMDWGCREWLDGSKDERFGRLGLTAQILSHKLRQVDDSWIPQLHWAARELGKTDWRKYGTDEKGAWCSEFAAWCLRKALWDIPTTPLPPYTGFGTGTMQDWFESQERKYTKDDVTKKRYILTPGDYLCLQLPDKHSALFLQYEDGDPERGPETPDDNTRLRTIEGNTSQTVAVRRSRTIGQIVSVGSTR